MRQLLWKRLLWICLIVLAAACSAPQKTDPTEIALSDSSSECTRTPFMPQDATPTTYPTVTPPATYTPTVTSTMTATPTETGCQEKQGQVIEGETQAAGFNGPLEFVLYLPPCYEENAPRKGYPLLTLIHGQTYTPQQWIDIGLAEKMDTLIKNDEILPFAVVMPYESTDYAVGFHDAIIDDLIPYLQTNYEICEGRECLAIGGISRGGGWALTAAFKHPDVFSSLGLHSTPVSDGHLEMVRYGAASAGLENLPRIYLDYGENDYWSTSEKILVDTFDQIGVPFTYVLNTGSHDNVYWETHLNEYLRWYAAGWD